MSGPPLPEGEPVPVNGQTVAGVTVPDTKLAREAADLVRAATTDVLERYVPSFQRGNFVDVILDSDWPE